MIKTTIGLEDYRYNLLERLSEEYNKSVNDTVSYIIFCMIKKTRQIEYTLQDREFIRREVFKQYRDANHDVVLSLAKIRKTLSLMSEALAAKYKDRPDEFMQLHKSVEKNFNLFYAGVEMETAYFNLKKMYDIKPTKLPDWIYDEIEQSDE